MPTLLDYRRRVRSVKNTQQITRAMKFVAAAKLRRAQEGVFAARPYAHEILRVLRSAAARMENVAHPLLVRRPEEKILVVVLTGDRSLAGAFNSNVIRHASEFMREHSSK
jgi:F-type H+-transporting ATPase subunit gamma